MGKVLSLVPKATAEGTTVKMDCYWTGEDGKPMHRIVPVVEVYHNLFVPIDRTEGEPFRVFVGSGVCYPPLSAYQVGTASTMAEATADYMKEFADNP